MSNDEQVRRDVLAAIGGAAVVNAALINVAVRDGVVTVTGELNTHVEQWNLERACRDVRGIASLDFDMDFTAFWIQAGDRLPARSS